MLNRMRPNGMRAGGALLAIVVAAGLAGCSAPQDQSPPPPDPTPTPTVEALPAPTQAQLTSVVPSGDALADYGWEFLSATDELDTAEVRADSTCIEPALDSLRADDGRLAYELARSAYFSRGASDSLQVALQYYPEHPATEVLEAYGALGDCGREEWDGPDGLSAIEYSRAATQPDPRADGALGIEATGEFEGQQSVTVSATYVGCGDLVLLVSGTTGFGPLGAADLGPVVDRALASIESVLPGRC